jgi:uncharacterized membrane protein (UPF0127 family)
MGNSGLSLVIIATLALVIVVAATGIYLLLPRSASLDTIATPCYDATLQQNYSGTEIVPGLTGFAVEGLCVLNVDSSSIELGGYVYVASSSSEQEQGFQNVPNFGNCNGNASLSTSCIGMIFVTGQEQNLCLWMHNTEIALQQVWISSSSIVTSVYQAQPYNDTSVCHNGQFVLETFPSVSIVPGDRVETFNASTR